MRTPIKRSSLVRLLCERRAAGAELVEFAFILPLLLTLLVGVFWIGRGYNIYQTITRAAREGARVATIRTCALCGNAVTSNSDVRLAVTNAMQASSLDPSKVTNNFSGSCPVGQSCDCPSGDICIIRDVPLNTGTPQEFGVVISFSFPFNFNLPFTSQNLATINIPTKVQMREEN
jgi:hypothetical protein